MRPENAIASNCRRLRTAKGLSQVDLAEKVGLSRPGYLKVESGESIPRSDTLERIALAFNVSIAELVRPVARLEHVRFRSKKRINSREELLIDVKRRLDAYAALAQALDVRKVPSDVAVPKGDPKAAAEVVRKALLKEHHDEPVRDICGLVESSGYRLLLVTLTSAFHEGAEGEDHAEGFFGLSVLGNSNAPAIVVNNFERISVERRIFTVAHELGHLHLHRDSYKAGESDEHEQEEREADLFASHFLMPDALFKKEWGDAYGQPFIDRVLKVKRIFRVSYKTVLRRLEDEKMEGPGLYPKFFGIYKRRFNRSLKQKEEPKPLEDVDFKQDLLPTLVRRGVEHEVLSHSKAAELLGMDLQEFRNVASEWKPQA
jgi:Zn-dependent peptidase ImmA (M78 family)/transcriptional regulator with XRE-family HTH domain